MAGHTKSTLGGGAWGVPLRWQLMLWWIQASTLGWVAVVAAGAFWTWLWVRCRIHVHRNPHTESPQSPSRADVRRRVGASP